MDLRGIVQAAKEGGERAQLVEQLGPAVDAVRAAGVADMAVQQLRILGAIRGWGGIAKGFERDLTRKRLHVVEGPQEPDEWESDGGRSGLRPSQWERDEGGKPRIEIEADGEHTIQRAWQTLMPCCDSDGVPLEEPPIFRMAGGLVRVIDGKPVEVGADALRGIMAERAEYWRWKADKDGGGEWVQIPLPPRDLSAIMAAPATFSATQIPVLESVMATPYLGKNGSIRAKPGYNADDRVLLLNHGLELRRMDVGEAVALLNDWLVDFPFLSFTRKDENGKEQVWSAGFAHAVGLALTPLVRRIISGPVPPVLIEAPKPRTGKTLLAQVLAQPSVGEVSVSTLAEREEERGKALFSTLLKGRPVAILDNLKGQINSPTLEAVLTAWPSYEARVLGVSQDVEVPARTQWILTTNNGSFSEDMVGRLVAIRLDRRCERPDLIDVGTLRHPDIKQYTTENRANLLSALFSLVTHWRNKGRPKSPEGTPYKGSFEGWRDVIGGILGAAGIFGFLRGEGASRAEIDEWRAFICSWAQKFGANKAKIGELQELALSRGLLGEILGPGNEESQRLRLGRGVGSRKDQIVSVTNQLIVDVLGDDNEEPATTISKHENAGDGYALCGDWRIRGLVRVHGSSYYQLSRT